MAKLPAKLPLPEQVAAVQERLSQEPSHELSQIAAKLIANTRELVRMWRTLEKYKRGNDELWVWAFLGAAAHASDLPSFHYRPRKERRELSNRIAGLATELSRALKEHGLDGHVVQIDEKILNGFFAFEDLSESRRAYLDAAGTRKLKASELIKGIGERAQQKIADEPRAGKVSRNVRAVRFVRLMADRNRLVYRKVLNEVIATAANAIFPNAHYSAGDVTNLLNR